MRGTPESLEDDYPAEVIEGIMLHRAVDQFTDSHPVFLQAKKYLPPERKRFAGIIIDIYFDHFLAQFWKEYSRQKLASFISEIHLLLERRDDWLPPELQALIPRMEAENWLGHYETIEDLALTFRRISQRRKFLKPLIGAEEDLTKHYQPFQSAFQDFYPEVIQFAQKFSYPASSSQ